MSSALIGHTGFVGGNLDRQLHFDERFHSKDIAAIKGRSFDIVYCAGVSAVKWAANREPENDLMGIVPLLTALESVQAERFVLLSTIDVYRNPVNVDEDTAISTDGLHAYGSHRRILETFVQERFQNHHIIRLPGLFGEQMKKNIIYDFLNANQMENIHTDAVFQFYGLDNLARDIRTVIDSDLRLMNFATEPITVKNIATHAFGIDFTNRPSQNPPRYDMRTRYARIFGGDGSYLYSGKQVLDQIKDFVLRQKRRGGA